MTLAVTVLAERPEQCSRSNRYAYSSTVRIRSSHPYSIACTLLVPSLVHAMARGHCRGNQ